MVALRRSQSFKRDQQSADLAEHQNPPPSSLPTSFRNSYAYVDAARSAEPSTSRSNGNRRSAFANDDSFKGNHQTDLERSSSRPRKRGPVRPSQLKQEKEEQVKSEKAVTSPYKRQAEDTKSISACSKAKKKRTSAKLKFYDSTSYPPVIDHLRPSDPTRRLDVLVCGLNPGLRSSTTGQHFAHPSNHFYRTLHFGGLTPTRVAPADCAEMLDQPPPWPSIGLTNICGRPSREGGELGKEDYERGTPILALKIRDLAKPRITVFTGKGIGGEWERCCQLKGALLSREKLNGKKKGLHVPIKAEVGELEGDDCRYVSLPFSKSVPWALEEKTSLGLLPYVIDLLPSLSTSIKKEDEEENGAVRRFPAHSASEHARFSFFFLTTSPSGRVTTMGLPEKSAWMGKLKTCADWLMTSLVSNGEEAKQAEEEEEEEVLWRRFEIVDVDAFHVSVE